MKCDFCSSDQPHWEYIAHDVPMGAEVLTIPTISRGSWYACDACHEDIEQNDWLSVRERCYESYCREYGRPVEDEAFREFVYTVTELAWKAFRSARFGVRRMEGG